MFSTAGGTGIRPEEMVVDAIGPAVNSSGSSLPAGASAIQSAAYTLLEVEATGETFLLDGGFASLRKHYASVRDRGHGQHQSAIRSGDRMLLPLTHSEQTIAQNFNFSVGGKSHSMQGRGKEAAKKGPLTPNTNLGSLANVKMRTTAVRTSVGGVGDGGRALGSLPRVPRVGGGGGGGGGRRQRRGAGSVGDGGADQGEMAVQQASAPREILLVRVEIQDMKPNYCDERCVRSAFW